jgi:hypothetical protein
MTSGRAGYFAVPSPRGDGWPTPRTHSPGWPRAVSADVNSARRRSPWCCSPPPRSPGTALVAPLAPSIRRPATGPSRRRTGFGRTTVPRPDAAHEHIRSPPGRPRDLLPSRVPLPGARRDHPRGAERDAGHRARRRDRGQHRPAHRLAGGVRGRGRLRRRQRLLPAGAAVRTLCAAQVLHHAEGKGGARVGGTVTRPVRRAADRGLPFHPRRAHCGDPYLRGHRLSAPPVRPGDRGGRHHLGVVRVLHRPHRRAGIREQPMGGPRHRVRRHPRDQRANRAWPPPVAASAVTAVRA